MTTGIAKGFRDFAFKMRHLKANQEDQANGSCLSERESLILELLYDKGNMTVSQIALADPGACDSTISNTITKLWRNKKMVTKTVSPQNQRNTIIGLTYRGRQRIETFMKLRDERFKTLFNAVNATDEEKKILLNLLKQVSRFLDQRLGIKSKNNNSEI